jgi:hypothetical protein
MAVANTLAYYDTATITAVKCFIVQAPGWVKKGLFEYKCALALILLTFIHTKLMKYKAFNKVVELNKSFL